MDSLEKMRNDKIMYLVEKKFSTNNRQLVASLKEKPLEQEGEYLQQVALYRQELEGKHIAEISAIYDAEKTKENHNQQLVKLLLETPEEKEEREEQQRFFNKPEAQADFDYWSKAAYWTLEEAHTLSYKKNPRIVNFESLNQVKGKSKFITLYKSTYNLVSRANEARELSQDVFYVSEGKVEPEVFIAWARSKDIDFPKELEQLVIKRMGKVKNWEQEYNNLEIEAKEHRNTVRIQQTYIEQLETQLSEAKNNQFIDGYISPYVKLMQQAVIANKVTETNQPKKQTLVQWIKDNAPDGLKISNNIAESMATLIRSPEAAKGGNVKVS